MQHDELSNKIIVFLAREAKHNKSRPRNFPAKQVAEKTGGVATSVGRVADQVVRELSARNIKVRYDRSGSPTKFVLE